MRAAWLVVAVLSLTLMLLPAARLSDAADDGPTPHAAGEKAKAAEHSAGHGESGEHKAADPFAQALDLTIWTVVVFLVLLLVLRLFAWGPMLKALKDREHSIRTAL